MHHVVVCNSPLPLNVFVYQLIDHKLTSVPAVQRNVYLVVITIFLLYFIQQLGYAVAQLVEVLHY